MDAWGCGVVGACRSRKITGAELSCNVGTAKFATGLIVKSADFALMHSGGLHAPKFLPRLLGQTISNLPEFYSVWICLERVQY